MPTRLTEQSSAIVDSSGNCSIVLGPPPTGTVWLGSVNVVNAPATSYWSVLTGGTLWGACLGASAVVAQAVHGEQIVVAATGLTVGAVFVAAIRGSVYQDAINPRTGQPIEPIPWASPIPQPIATAGVSVGFTGTGAGSGGSASPPTAPTSPGGPGTSATYSVSVLNVLITNVAGSIAAGSLPGTPANAVAWTLSIPTGGANVWVFYGANAGATNNGILVPAGATLYESTWMGAIFGISDGANVSAGMQVIRRS